MKDGVSKMLRRSVIVSLVLVAALVSGCASVMKASCSAPEVTSWAAPSVFVLKFPFALDPSLRGVVAAESIDPLLDLQSVAIASNLVQTNLTLLTSSPGEPCDVARAYDAVTAKKSGLLGRRLYRSAIFVWGDIVQRGGVLYTQTSMRVFWNDRDGTVTMRYAMPGIDQPLRFVGRFPGTTITFPPQPISDATLAKLTTQADRLKPRAAPNIAAPTVELPQHFTIAGSSHGWILLVPKEGAEAWLSIEAIADTSIELVPEMEFVRAVAAYLQFTASGSERSARISEESLRLFTKSAPTGSAAQSLPLAIGDVIRGTLKQAARGDGVAAFPGAACLLTGGATPDDALNASSAVDFESAISRNTRDSDILTLSALGKIAGLCRGTHESARSEIEGITQSLQAARRYDVASPEAVLNLANWYRLLSRVDTALTRATGEEMTDRANALERAMQVP